MVTKIQKWGNSLALRIPKPLADQIGLEMDSAVELQVINGQLHIVPVQPADYRLDKLLDGITTENIHSEVDTGYPRGDETW
ncbi:MAG: AbrB/MazE/SpoVT family DNA-binding domain-containing protein [Phototrophicaceae bacterium]